MLRFVKFWQGVGVMAEQYPERRTYECLKFAIWNTAQGWQAVNGLLTKIYAGSKREAWDDTTKAPTHLAIIPRLWNAGSSQAVRIFAVIRFIAKNPLLEVGKNQGNSAGRYKL